MNDSDILSSCCIFENCRVLAGGDIHVDTDFKANDLTFDSDSAI